MSWTSKGATSKRTPIRGRRNNSSVSGEKRRRGYYRKRRKNTDFDHHEVKSENCNALLDLIMHETQSFVRHLPGFVSANLHRNAESTRVVNYGQWESPELYEKARAHHKFKEFSKRVEALAEKITPTAYDVVFTEERWV